MIIRFVYKDGVMKAYRIGPKGGMHKVDYHTAWLAVATGHAMEEIQCSLVASANMIANANTLLNTTRKCDET